MKKTIEYLPEHLREEELWQVLCDLIDYVSPTEEDFQRVLYRFDSSTVAADYERVFEELGFEYITDLFTLSTEQRSVFLFFLYLIVALKGHRKGLELVLDLAGVQYQIQEWWEQSPQGPQFTFVVNITSDISVLGWNFVQKFQTFCSRYVLPELTNVSVVYNLGAIGTWTSVGGFVDQSYTATWTR